MSLSQEWLDELALTKRRRPEFYLPNDDITDEPHAATLRVTFEDLNLAAVFCVEDVPTIGFVVLDQHNPDTIDEIHRALWNQGQMTLLVVICGDVLRAYSLSRLPKRAKLEGTADSRLVFTLNRLNNALELKELILSVESGRLWEEHPEAFSQKERIDRVLLDNLMTAFRKLRQARLSVEAAQALLMQTMFIAYLEDREVIGQEYFHEATRKQAGSLVDLLSIGNAKLLDYLFARLRKDFNGDIFLTPCAFELKKKQPRVQPEHFSILERFRWGREIMDSGQQRFWGYDFKYIPVVLLSAVYDRFLEENPETRRKEGAYYTPMFLVDTVVSQVWEKLTEQQRINVRALDPACGSGIFLVRLFQRLVEHRRARSGRAVPWRSLVAIFKRLNGMDTNASALRVATFSLYIALLEQIKPPDIRTLMARGKILPELWGDSLRPHSFFGEPADAKYDVIIGNPPWASRRGNTGDVRQWCEKYALPCPSVETAWGFIWKAGMHLTPKGYSALLLPAMGVLHNHSSESVRARRQLFKDYCIKRIVNFSDLTFQLFDGANRPAALILYHKHEDRLNGAYRFEYWSPKADLNLRLKRLLTLSRSDRSNLRSDFVAKDPRLFKRRLWMRQPDEKLLQFLTSLPRVRDLVEEFKDVSRGKKEARTGWIIGQGFKPVNVKRIDDPKYIRTQNEMIARYPFLDIETFHALALPIVQSKPWPDTVVHRTGFIEGFTGPCILIPQGVKRDEGRVRAAYTEQNLTFRSSIQAIKFPPKERARAKLLTAILNSSLSAWFVFHETAYLGTDRAKVLQGELLEIPFPSPEDLSDPKDAQAAADQMVHLIDNAGARAKKLLTEEGNTLREIDQLVYKYYGLSENEIAVVEDTLSYLIPAMQPTADEFPLLWKPCEHGDRATYADTLTRALVPWLTKDAHTEIALAGISRDLVILRLQLVKKRKANRGYIETMAGDISSVLNRIWDTLPMTLPGNFQVIPDLRIFLDGDLYLVKPRQLRYWLRSSALADADEIAADLHQASRTQRRKARISNADW